MNLKAIYFIDDGLRIEEAELTGSIDERGERSGSEKFDSILRDLFK